MLTLVGVIVAVPYLYQRVDEEVRLRVEARFAQHYSHLKVSVRSAALVEDEGIRIRGISICEPSEVGPCAELVHFEEVLLSCRTSLKDLIKSDLEVTQVTIRRPTIRTTCSPTGDWSISKVLPLPKFSDSPPKITVENGTLEILQTAQRPSNTLTFRDINLTLDKPSPETHVRQVEGTLIGNHISRIEFQGRVNPNGEDWSLSGQIEKLSISPESRALLPRPLSDRLSEVGSLRGTANLDFRVTKGRSPDKPYEFQVSGKLKEGRINDSRVPYPLTNISAAFQCSNSGYSVENLFARSGQSTLRLSCRKAGFSRDSCMTMSIEARHLDLDRKLFDALPGSIQDQWHKYLPTGRIHANLDLTFNGRGWHPDGVIQCADVSFSYFKFPYRLEHGNGTIQLKDNVVCVNMTAFSGQHPIRISAVVNKTPSGPHGWAEVRCDEINIDDKLLTAIPKRSRSVIRSLNPRGKINFFVRTWRDAPNEPMHTHFLLGIDGCSMRFDKFEYPIQNIRGTAEMLNGHWSFRNLRGDNGTGQIMCDGAFKPGTDGNHLHLELACTGVPLEEELRCALKPNIQRFWGYLKPRGTVDLNTTIDYLDRTKKLDVAVEIRPQGDTVSVEPIVFPYRLEKLRGRFFYRDGHVTMQNVKASHGNVKVASNGSCSFLPDGSWKLHLTDVVADRLRMNRELSLALPGRLRKAITTLNPKGPINLRGTLEFTRGPNASIPIQSRWDVAIGFHQGSIDCGVKLENMYGDMTLKGKCDGKNLHSYGKVKVDSLTYKDVQFTQISSSLWIDDQAIFLGTGADQRIRNISRKNQNIATRSLTAKLFGGTANGDCWVSLGPVPRYGINATLYQADLNQLAQEMIPGEQHLTGKVLAKINLGGSGQRLNSLNGRGNIKLRDANIYELPLMISLLKILSVRMPDPTAFSKSDIDFRIVGNHIYFDRIDFNGDAISLIGKGEMNFQSEIRLTFHTMVGRDELRIPILRPILGSASEQMMQIHVAGTLSNPETSRKAFPGLNQAIQQLQSDIPKRANPLQQSVRAIERTLLNR